MDAHAASELARSELLELAAITARADRQLLPRMIPIIADALGGDGPALFGAARACTALAEEHAGALPSDGEIDNQARPDQVRVEFARVFGYAAVSEGLAGQVLDAVRRLFEIDDSVMLPRLVHAALRAMTGVARQHAVLRDRVFDTLAYLADALPAQHAARVFTQWAILATWYPVYQAGFLQSWTARLAEVWASDPYASDRILTWVHQFDGKATRACALLFLNFINDCRDEHEVSQIASLLVSIGSYIEACGAFRHRADLIREANQNRLRDADTLECEIYAALLEGEALFGRGMVDDGTECIDRAAQLVPRWVEAWDELDRWFADLPALRARYGDEGFDALIRARGHGRDDFLARWLAFRQAWLSIDPDDEPGLGDQASHLLAVVEGFEHLGPDLDDQSENTFLIDTARGFREAAAWWDRMNLGASSTPLSCVTAAAASGAAVRRVASLAEYRLPAAFVQKYETAAALAASLSPSTGIARHARGIVQLPLPVPRRGLSAKVRWSARRRSDELRHVTVRRTDEQQPPTYVTTHIALAGADVMRDCMEVRAGCDYTLEARVRFGKTIPAGTLHLEMTSQLAASRYDLELPEVRLAAARSIGIVGHLSFALPQAAGSPAHVFRIGGYIRSDDGRTGDVVVMGDAEVRIEVVAGVPDHMPAGLTRTAATVPGQPATTAAPQPKRLAEDVLQITGETVRRKAWIVKYRGKNIEIGELALARFLVILTAVFSSDDGWLDVGTARVPSGVRNREPFHADAFERQISDVRKPFAMVMGGDWARSFIRQKGGQIRVSIAARLIECDSTTLSTSGSKVLQDAARELGQARAQWLSHSSD